MWAAYDENGRPQANSAGTWNDISSAYGLGAPPAVGMPASMPGVQVGAPPMLNTDMGQFNDWMRSINGQIGDAYSFDTPMADTSLIDMSQVQNPQAQQFAQSDELKKLLSGQGYNPDILAKMKAGAVDNPAKAGLQQMAQMKRVLGQNGISGGAAAAMQGDIARQTGRQQGENLSNVDIQNADVSNKNFLQGVGFQTQIGLNNMQQANQMAMQNANRMFEALRANQSASNNMNQFNTGNKFSQNMNRAGAQSNFLGQQGAQGQQWRADNERENANKQWQSQQQQTGYDWERQRAQWDELNRRFSQAQGTLGQWGNA